MQHCSIPSASDVCNDSKLVRCEQLGDSEAHVADGEDAKRSQRTRHI